jgi:mannose-6-phosphate isomerase-like protein (cupin superfamily)
MDEAYLKFSGEADVTKTYVKLLSKEHLLDDVIAEIELLVRGTVKPADTIRRSKVGSYFSSAIQQIGNYVDKHNVALSNELKTNISRLAYKADKILRENIVLQSIPPLDVIPFKNVPIRHSYSTFGRREQRWGYGLHMKRFNEEGDSITLADMPPRYTQSVHNHTLSEYCLILDSTTEGIYFPGGKREKIYSTQKHEMLHFSATTPHTLRNPSKIHTRNITFKHSLGLIDWKPITALNVVKIVRARLVRGRLKKINANQTIKKFYVNDKYYKYILEIIKLNKETTYTTQHQYDQFIFVINGKFKIFHENIEKECKKNDFIVIDKNTSYKIITSTTCRLYTVHY